MEGPTVRERILRVVMPYTHTMDVVWHIERLEYLMKEHNAFASGGFRKNNDYCVECYRLNITDEQLRALIEKIKAAVPANEVILFNRE